VNLPSPCRSINSLSRSAIWRRSSCSAWLPSDRLRRKRDSAAQNHREGRGESTEFPDSLIPERRYVMFVCVTHHRNRFDSMMSHREREVPGAVCRVIAGLFCVAALGDSLRNRKPVNSSLARRRTRQCSTRHVGQFKAPIAAPRRRSENWRSPRPHHHPARPSHRVQTICVLRLIERR
jgi:hypothetical protein